MGRSEIFMGSIVDRLVVARRNLFGFSHAEHQERLQAAVKRNERAMIGVAVDITPETLVENRHALYNLLSVMGERVIGK